LVEPSGIEPLTSTLPDTRGQKLTQKYCTANCRMLN